MSRIVGSQQATVYKLFGCSEEPFGKWPSERIVTMSAPPIFSTIGRQNEHNTCGVQTSDGRVLANLSLNSHHI